MSTAQSFKFNWGWGILLFFSSFVAFMIFMVYMTTTVDHDLVTSDYYNQEIEYQNKIDMKSNLAKSGQHVQISKKEKSIEVNLPIISNTSIEKAEVYFYRASDETKDVKSQIHENGKFEIPVDQLIRGEYIIKSQWTENGISYYEEIKYTHL